MIPALMAGTNADLIVACNELGYINGEVLDATYATGRFWNDFRPEKLTTNDIDERYGDHHHDFRAFPHQWRERFDTAVLDPPYKLSGTASMGGPASSDDSYGVKSGIPWQERMKLIEDGITGCWRVLAPGGHFLLKCQDQVCSGKVRWQTKVFWVTAFDLGLELVDEMHLVGAREQPAGRRQVHARRNYSTLQIYKKPKR